MEKNTLAEKQFFSNSRQSSSFAGVNPTIFFTVCGQRLKSIKKDYKPLQFTRGILHGVYRVYKTSIGERVNARTFFLSIR